MGRYAKCQKTKEEKTVVGTAANITEKSSCYDRTKTLLSLFSALLSAAVLFLASLSGARSRGNLGTVLGLRLPERLVVWLSFVWLSPLRSESSVGSGLETGGGGGAPDDAVPLGSDARRSDLSEDSGVGGRFPPAAAAPLMAGSCGPCSGMAATGAGGGAALTRWRCCWRWACSAVEGVRSGGVAMYCWAA